MQICVVTHKLCFIILHKDGLLKDFFFPICLKKVLFFYFCLHKWFMEFLTIFVLFSRGCRPAFPTPAVGEIGVCLWVMLLKRPSIAKIQNIVSCSLRSIRVYHIIREINADSKWFQRNGSTEDSGKRNAQYSFDCGQTQWLSSQLPSAKLIGAQLFDSSARRITISEVDRRLFISLSSLSIVLRNDLL